MPFSQWFLFFEQTQIFHFSQWALFLEQKSKCLIFSRKTKIFHFFQTVAPQWAQVQYRAFQMIALLWISYIFQIIALLWAHHIYSHFFRFLLSEQKIPIIIFQKHNISFLTNSCSALSTNTIIFSKWLLFFLSIVNMSYFSNDFLLFFEHSSYIFIFSEWLLFIEQNINT